MYRKSLIAVTIGIALLLILLFFWRSKNQNELKSNGLLVEAKVVRVTVGGRGTGGFKYLIKYGNKEKILSSPSSLLEDQLILLAKHFLLCIYQKRTSWKF